MLTIKEYVVVKSLEEAFELNKLKSNKIIAGNGWLKMQTKNINKAIDLSALNLDYINEQEDCFEIGCMTKLRDIEININLNNYTNNAFKKALKGIVGVQFRNCVTVGGSVYSRFGFSDVNTLLLSLNAKVKLYQKGIISLKEYCDLPYDNDILIEIIIPKHRIKVSYQSFRVQSTDLPIINIAIAKTNTNVRVAIGARPHKAKVLEFSSLLEAENCSDLFEYGSNMRAKKEYRKHLAGVLLKRGLKELTEVQHGN